MEFNNNRITELTWKYLRDELSESERAELNEWLADPYNKERFDQRIRIENILEGLTVLSSAKEEVGSPGWESRVQLQTTKVVPLGETVPSGRRRFRWMAAAAVLLVIGGSTLLWRISHSDIPKNNPAPFISSDLPPGGSKATLTLADGSMVRLDDARQGTVARQGSSDVVKESDGRLAYRKGAASGMTGFNTIATPRGGQYRVVLPDGSQVWLNAGSSIKFPTTFSGREREVALTGQGYFETVKDPDHPFVVKVGKMQVRVLGTSFDVMAYEDEQTMNTSLINGAVAVASGGQEVVLHPEQQARVDAAGGMIVKKVNVEEVVAWKNGALEFNGADIGTVMRAVSRWWDVDVRYAAKGDSHAFTGQLSKDLHAADALKILATSGYHFKMEGRTITVLP